MVLKQLKAYNGTVDEDEDIIFPFIDPKTKPEPKTCTKNLFYSLMHMCIIM